MVKINYNNYLLRKTTRTSADSIGLNESLSLIALINMLSKKYGPEFKRTVIDMEEEKLKVLILINGIRIDDLKYEIKDKDKINIIPLITGG